MRSFKRLKQFRRLCAFICALLILSTEIQVFASECKNEYAYSTLPSPCSGCTTLEEHRVNKGMCIVSEYCSNRCATDEIHSANQAKDNQTKKDAWGNIVDNLNQPLLPAFRQPNPSGATCLIDKDCKYGCIDLLTHTNINSIASSTVEKSTSAEDEAKKKASADKIKEYLEKLWGTAASDIAYGAAVQEISTMVTILEACGWSRGAIAGALVNAYHESGLFPYAIQGIYSNHKGYSSFYAKLGGTSYGLKIDGNTSEYASVQEYEKAFSSTDRYTVELTHGKSNFETWTPTYARGFGLFQFTDYTNTETNRASARGSYIVTAGEALDQLSTTAKIKFASGTSLYRYNLDKDNLTTDEIDIIQIPMTKFSQFVNIPGTEVQCGIINSSFTITDATESGYDAKGGSYGSTGWQPVGYMEKLVPDLAEEFKNMTFEQYKTLSGDDWQKASLAFLLCVERPAEEHAGDRVEEIRVNDVTSTPAIIASMVLDGDIAFNLNTNAAAMKSFGLSSSSESESLTYMSELASTGFFTESDLANYASLSELNVDAVLLSNAIRSNLTSQELKTLADWERNVKVNSFENTMVVGARKVLVLFGILVEIWSLLIYLAYWFDRLNNFIPIDLLHILSLGRLRIADDVTEATYSLRNNSSKSRVKTVNHRAVLFIVILGLTFGTLIISGYIFVLLESVILKIRQFLR